MTLFFFWPIHPKIIKIIDIYKIKIPKNIVCTSPLSYLDTIAALMESKFVVTDSGGIQKEAYFLKKKSFVLRNETEWNELIKLKAVKLIGDNIMEIKKNKNFLNSKILFLSKFGDGNSTKKISNLINKILS